MNKIKLDYKNGFVAFLDILGFKEMVNKDDSSTIEKYLNIVNEVLTELHDNKDLSDFKSIVISDSIILSMEYVENDKVRNISTLRILCMAISKLQTRLIKNGILLRGAVSYGKIHFDNINKQVIGKGYTNAYELEGSYALYPRVILDNTIIDLFGYQTSGEFIDKINEKDEKYNILYKWEEKYSFDSIHKMLFGIKKDVPLFIDYLGYLKEDDKLMNVVEFIKEEAKKDIKNYPKYQWLAQYIISKLDTDNEIVNMLKQV